jgi:hypothetical protein
MFIDHSEFLDNVKQFKKLARGNAPVKSPGHYSDKDIVVGRNGKLWRTHRVIYYPPNDIERYELVWLEVTN